MFNFITSLNICEGIMKEIETFSSKTEEAELSSKALDYKANSSKN